jgi:hypothetical protein
MFPRWFLVVWDVFALVVVAAGIAQLRLDPAVIAFLAVGGGFMASIRFVLWFLSDPRRNFVELKSESLRIRIGDPLMGTSVEIPYSRLQKVDENAVHTFWPFWVWPHRPLRAHIDLVLRRRQAISGFPLGWLRVIHLDVADRQRFAAELRDALAGDSSAPDRT